MHRLQIYSTAILLINTDTLYQESSALTIVTGLSLYNGHHRTEFRTRAEERLHLSQVLSEKCDSRNVHIRVSLLSGHGRLPSPTSLSPPKFSPYTQGYRTIEIHRHVKCARYLWGVESPSTPAHWSPPPPAQDGGKVLAGGGHLLHTDNTRWIIEDGWMWWGW